MSDQLDAYYSRKSAFKYAAEAFNVIASSVNALGGSMGTLTIPTGLGFAPLVIPVAYAAAITGAAVLIGWAIGWLETSQNMMLDIAAAQDAAGDHEGAAKTRTKAADVDAQRKASGGTLGDIANMVKWAAIGVGVYLIVDLMEKR